MKRLFCEASVMLMNAVATRMRAKISGICAGPRDFIGFNGEEEIE
jgi:hypothetical protein